MWVHRNKALYTKGEGIYKEELSAMDRTIREEFTIRLNRLDSSMDSFFRGLITQKLKMSPNLKI